MTDADTIDLPEVIKRMWKASSVFYCMAVQTHNHAFIEFAGLINEYIILCRDAMEAGQDFTQASTHTGERLPFASHHIRYIREKLECIYGLDVLKRDV